MNLLVLLLAAAVPQDDEVRFNRDIRPILSDRCFSCHGPDEKHRKAKLRLDTNEGADGAYRVRRRTAAIKPGAPDASELWHRITSRDPDEVMPPADAHKKPLSPAEQALFRKWIEQGAKYEGFWAYVPPRPVDPPKVADPEWGRGFIDPVVRADLAARGLEPKGVADKRTLIRRVTFDLTGLPPSVEEIRAFLADEDPEAYGRLVDDLLKRPAYGEHMARYWADLVRLADTNGMHKDFYRNFSTYRDWLIRAFNDNLPFDDFVKYQVAGDLYPDATEDQLVASGFNRLHMIIDKGTALPEESFHKNVVDRVEAFGTAFLGMTVQCAQCHDHKYDPITQKEYYRLYAFFNNFDGAPETVRAPKDGLQPPFIELKESKQGGVKAMVMKERARPRKTHLLVGGAYDAPGEEVRRGTPAFLPPLKQKGEIATRMDLAEWLTDPAHPLTARVAVNRIWQQFFGVGLVKTAEDLGSQGDVPSHPDLLDGLAVSFVKSGWDVKKLVREIVLSRTYRQSSDATRREYLEDPENRRLARGSRFRMDAEMIRDQILFVSGTLNPEMYGPSVKPPQPPGLWEAVSMAAPFTYKADTGDRIHRRSFYSYWRRAIPPPQMTILNAPSREYCVARRERTNTSLQALLLMNEQQYFAMARACAELVMKASDGDEKKGLADAYERITSHLPDARRSALLQRALADFRSHYAKNPGLAAALTKDLEGLDEKKRAELSAWTMVVHGLMNLELAKVRR